MSKPEHPIRKLEVALYKAGSKYIYEERVLRRESLIARHVKPLLNIAEVNHRKRESCPGEGCPDCATIAAWKEPLR